MALDGDMRFIFEEWDGKRWKPKEWHIELAHIRQYEPKPLGYWRDILERDLKFTVHAN